MFLIAILAVALLFAVFFCLFSRLGSQSSAEISSREWLEDFSLDSYAPMERLLDKSDFAFLASQPGYRPEIAKRLLADRRKVFNEYLGLLIGDFNRLHRLAKLMLVYSPDDRPDLATALLRQQLMFYFGVSLIRCKVALYPLGWTAVDVPKLLHSLEQVRREIQDGVLPPMVSSAL